jgi:hypothetical protein
LHKLLKAEFGRTTKQLTQSPNDGKQPEELKLNRATFAPGTGRLLRASLMLLDVALSRVEGKQNRPAACISFSRHDQQFFHPSGSQLKRQDRKTQSIEHDLPIGLQVTSECICFSGQYILYIMLYLIT